MSSRTSMTMQQAIEPILKGATPKYLTAKIIFESPTDVMFKYDPGFVTDIDIVQDFDNLLFDYIEVGFDINVSDYVRFIANYQGMRCSFKLSLLEDQNSAKAGDNVCSLNLRVVIKDMPDLEKSSQITQFVPGKDPNAPAETDAPDATQAVYTKRIVVQLYDERVFTLRKLRLNWILTNTDISSMLYLIHKQTEAYRCYIRKPDNTRIYKNLILPPVMPIAEALSYLQSGPGLGIYNQGFNAYYSRDVFYIYPRFDTKPPTAPHTVNFYLISPNDMLGLSAYHIYDADGNYHVICNEGAHSRQNTAEALENYGSALLTLDSSRVLGKSTTLSSGKVSVDPKIVSCKEILTSLNLVEDSYTYRYFADQFNPYHLTSMLAATNCTTLSTTWTCAIPFSMLPGHLVKYHYLQMVNEKPMQKAATAMCSSVIYSIRRSVAGAVQTYVCKATITLRCHNEDPLTK